MFIKIFILTLLFHCSSDFSFYGLSSNVFAQESGGNGGRDGGNNGGDKSGGDKSGSDKSEGNESNSDDNNGSKNTPPPNNNGTDKNGKGEHTSAETPVNEFSDKTYETLEAAGSKNAKAYRDALTSGSSSPPDHTVKASFSEDSVGRREMTIELRNREGAVVERIEMVNEPNGDMRSRVSDGNGKVINELNWDNKDFDSIHDFELRNKDNPTPGPREHNSPESPSASDHENNEKLHQDTERRRNEANGNIRSFEDHLSKASPEQTTEARDARSELEGLTRVSKLRVEQSTANQLEAENAIANSRQNLQNIADSIHGSSVAPEAVPNEPAETPQSKNVNNRLKSSGNSSAQNKSQSKSTQQNQSFSVSAVVKSVSSGLSNYAKSFSNFGYTNEATDYASNISDPNLDAYQGNFGSIMSYRKILGFSRAKQIVKATIQQVKAVFSKASDRVANDFANAMGRGKVSTKTLHEVKKDTELNPDLSDELLDEAAEAEESDGHLDSSGQPDPLTPEKRAEIVANAKAFLTKTVGGLPLGYKSGSDGSDGYIDCSRMAHQIYKNSNLDYGTGKGGVSKAVQEIVYEAVKGQGNLMQIPSDQAKLGDIVVHLEIENLSYDNHMGIVTEIDANGNVTKELSAQTRNLLATDRTLPEFKAAPKESKPGVFGEKWRVYRWSKKF